MKIERCYEFLHSKLYGKKTALITALGSVPSNGAACMTLGNPCHKAILRLGNAERRKRPHFARSSPLRPQSKTLQHLWLPILITLDRMKATKTQASPSTVCEPAILPNMMRNKKQPCPTPRKRCMQSMRLEGGHLLKRQHVPLCHVEG